MCIKIKVIEIKLLIKICAMAQHIFTGIKGKDPNKEQILVCETGSWHPHIRVLDQFGGYH